METPHNILVWLPTPLGDAICATPALRALRRHFAQARITFLASPFTQAILSPTPFADDWLNPENGLAGQVRQLRAQSFDTVILLKNSFSSALTARLANIKQRLGYARDGRSLLLTHRIAPPKDERGLFMPIPSVRYYLALAESLGAAPTDPLPELAAAQADQQVIEQLFPQVSVPDKPLVILVPGGAFGPSKRWPPERFAACAEALIERYDAWIIISVAPAPAERQAAEAIASHCRYPLTNLALTPLSGGQLKALFSRAALVLSNDTGPRHIAIALRRKIVTLFGPNNPAWTHMDYPDEIRLVGEGPCVPCDKPVCKAQQHYCMESITVEDVLRAAETLLNRGRDE